MSRTPLPAGRPADRKNQIVRALRQRIVSGELPPGERLPTRSELVSTFDASSVTVQRALDELIQDGFVRVSGRQGTFVAPEPPHLHHYALVFPHLPSDSKRWTRFWHVLHQECLSMQARGERELEIFYGVGALKRSEDQPRLERLVLAHRLAGLIFLSAPFALEGTPILEEPGIPRVAVKSSGPCNPVPAVAPARSSFFRRALEYLATSGRRRVAFLATTAGHRTMTEELLREFGLSTEPYWSQTVPLMEPEAACAAVHLLMHPGQAERPDALVICDDNLTAAAAAGLMAAGVRPPHDVLVVSHWNFPWPAAPVVPMRRLGFGAREVLRACFESIDAQRRGESVPEGTAVTARFEDELEFGDPEDE